MNLTQKLFIVHIMLINKQNLLQKNNNSNKLMDIVGHVLLNWQREVSKSMNYIKVKIT